MSNEVLRRAEIKWVLLMLEFLGHIMRKNGLKELVLRGSADGKQSRGEQRKKYLQT